MRKSVWHAPPYKEYEGKTWKKSNAGPESVQHQLKSNAMQFFRHVCFSVAAGELTCITLFSVKIKKIPSSTWAVVAWEGSTLIFTKQFANSLDPIK